MYRKIYFGMCMFFALIFDGNIENVFLCIFAIGLYVVYIDNDLMHAIKSIVISYLIVNLVMVLVFREKIIVSGVDLGSTKKNQKAVLLVYDGEGERYNVRERAYEIYEREGLSSLLSMTYKLNSYKKMYKKFGYSQFKMETKKFREDLGQTLGPNYKIYNTNLFTKPYLEQQVNNLINIGYKEIIVCPMFLTQGKDYELLKKRLAVMELVKYEISIKTIDSFWNSKSLAQYYKDRVMELVKSKKYCHGVLIVGLEDKNNLNQDILFREKIKEYIADEKGYNIKIKLPLLENDKRDIIKYGEELLEYGINSLYLVIPTSIFETIYLKSLAQKVIDNLKIPDGTAYYYIGPCNNADVFLEELNNKIILLENEGGS